MDAGRCRACGRPYSSGEVAGTGILRARSLGSGGPRVEFACPACKVVNELVPYGGGRYAPPGSPPPPAPAEEERRPPWLRAPSLGTGAEAKKAPVPTAGVAAEPPKEPPRVPPPPAPPPPVETREPDLTDPFAACAVLGVSPAADRKVIEEAYRERALQCHPDKVAHLDPEIRALADRKFRRLKEARDLLLGEE